MAELTVGVPKESYPGERRVALVPGVIGVYKRLDVAVRIESGAGLAAGFKDAEYTEHGAEVVQSRQEVFAADLLLQVRGYGANPEAGGAELGLLRPGQVLVGLHNPLAEPERARELAGKGVTCFALELLPRISRAQPMDALSSMATVAGYKAMLLAAAELGKMCPLMMTAAGTVVPAKVFVVGAGVAGLQAIATARRLGAVVQAYDVRPAVREQVESLGARFVELELETAEAEDAGGYAKELGEEFYRRQREMMARVVAESDVVITTAAVPGKRAPVLVTEPLIRSMRPGSVLVDLAAELGGNCELSKPGEKVVVDGVSILAPLNLPATVPHDASQMYARNVASFVANLVKDGQVQLNLDDEIIRDSLLTHGGQVASPKVRELLGLTAQPQQDG
jgi:NAD(P) transhydrogenase subunit alpha